MRTEDVNRVLPQAVSDLAGAATRALAADAAQDPSLTLATDTITPTSTSLHRLAGIEVAVFNRAVQVRRVAGLDEHVDLRKAFDHPREDIGQDPGQRVRARAQAQLAGGRVVVGHGAQVGRVAQQFPRAQQDARTRFRHGHRGGQYATDLYCRLPVHAIELVHIEWLRLPRKCHPYRIGGQSGDQ